MVASLPTGLNRTAGTPLFGATERVLSKSGIAEGLALGLRYTDRFPKVREAAVNLNGLSGSTYGKMIGDGTESYVHNSLGNFVRKEKYFMNHKNQVLTDPVFMPERVVGSSRIGLISEQRKVTTMDKLSPDAQIRARQKVHDSLLDSG